MLDKKNGKLNSRKKCSCSCATSIGTPPQPESLTLTLPIQLTIGFSLPSVRFSFFFSPSFYFIILFYVFRQHRPPDTPSYSRNLNYYLQWYFFGCILFLFFAIFFFCFYSVQNLPGEFIYIYICIHFLFAFLAGIKFFIFWKGVTQVDALLRQLISFWASSVHFFMQLPSVDSAWNQIIFRRLSKYIIAMLIRFQ